MSIATVVTRGYVFGARSYRVTRGYGFYILNTVTVSAVSQASSATLTEVSTPSSTTLTEVSTPASTTLRNA